MTPALADWPTDDMVWDSIRLTFSEAIAAKLSFKRWKDGIDIDYPTSEAMSFARQMFTEGFAAALRATSQTPDAVREAQVYTAELHLNGKYTWCIVKALPRVENVIQEFGYGPDAYRTAQDRLSEIKSALSTPSASAGPQAEASPTEEDFAKWSRVWHDTCETMMTVLGLSGSGSPQEMLAAVQAHVSAQPQQADGRAPDPFKGLDERLDRLLLTASDNSRFVLSTESARNIVGIVREWLRPKSDGVSADGRGVDFAAAAIALGFRQLPTGKWFCSQPTVHMNTAQKWDTAEQIFDWWGRASGNADGRGAVIEKCKRICRSAAKRCIREGIPGDSVANFIEQRIAALSQAPATDNSADQRTHMRDAERIPTTDARPRTISAKMPGTATVKSNINPGCNHDGINTDRLSDFDGNIDHEEQR